MFVSPINTIAKTLRRTVLLMFCSLAAPLVIADQYQDTVAEFKRAASSSDFFDTAHGFVVFPTIGKGGLGIGLAFGKGKAYVDGTFTGDVNMSQISIGFQIGGQAYSQIIFLKDKRAYDEFTSGSFEFGAHANAAVIKLGINLEATTKGHSASVSTGESAQTAGAYYKGMAIFTLVKGGLMAEASIGGQKFRFRSVSNLPGYRDISIEDLKDG